MPHYKRNFGIEKQTKGRAKVRSHRERVKAAIEYCKKEGIDISIFDREAYVEFFLIKDLMFVNRAQYERVAKKIKGTEEGKFQQERQLEKLQYLYYMLKKIQEVLEGKLDVGAYSDVWRAIPEHQLKTAAGSMKHLDALIEMVGQMLKDIDEEAFELAIRALKGKEFMEDLRDHDENSRKVYGIPDELPEEIAQVVPPETLAEVKGKSDNNVKKHEIN